MITENNSKTNYKRQNRIICVTNLAKLKFECNWLQKSNSVWAAGILIVFTK